MDIFVKVAWFLLILIIVTNLTKYLRETSFNSISLIEPKLPFNLKTSSLIFYTKMST